LKKILVLITLIIALPYAKNLASCRISEQYRFRTDSLYTISGVVIDTLTKEPIELANIVLFCLKDSAFVQGANTDKSGKLKLYNILPGQYLMKISFIGYKPKLFEFDLRQDTVRSIFLDTIYIATTNLAMKEIHVSAEKEKVIIEKDKIIFNVSRDIASVLTI
jgi:hypothetical protein